MPHTGRVVAVVRGLQTGHNGKVLVVDKHNVGGDNFHLFSSNGDGDTWLVRVVPWFLLLVARATARARPHHVRTCILHAQLVAMVQLVASQPQYLVLVARHLFHKSTTGDSSSKGEELGIQGASKARLPALYFLRERLRFIRRAPFAPCFLCNSSVRHLKR